MNKDQIKDAIYYLGICQELWQWMHDEGKTSRCDKENWSGWKIFRTMENACPCCEYESKYYKNIRRCVHGCLLQDLWPNGCEHSPSPYFSFSYDRGMKSDALKIVNACKTKIKILRALLKEADDERN